LNRLSTTYVHSVVGYSDLQPVSGVEFYGARALVCSEPDDVVVMPETLKAELDWIRAHYERAGLPTSRNVRWGEGFEAIRDAGSFSVFMFGREAHGVRPDEKWFRMTGLTNSKNGFSSIVQELCLPAPGSVPLEGAGDSRALDAVSYPCFLKRDVSANGIGVWRCSNPGEVLALTAVHEGPFQLQEEVEAVVFLNVQYEVVTGTACHLATTEQILCGFQYQGNKHPAGYDVRRVTDKVAQWMADSGMKGVFAFDVAVDASGNPFVLECNPRWNGATYFTRVAQRLGVEFWTGRNCATRFRTLAGIDLGDCEYRPGKSSGAVIVNWGTILLNKLGILLIGDEQERMVLDRQLTAMLS
jgi:hypothetical protein